MVPLDLGLERVAHVGIATDDLERAVAFYRDTLGMRVVHEEELPAMGVRLVFLEKGGDEVELLQPTRDGSPIAGFLAKRGPGLHHLAFAVEDVAAALAKLGEAGHRLIDAAPRPGARGHRVAFLHPKAAGGVLIELVEELG